MPPALAHKAGYVFHYITNDSKGSKAEVRIYAGLRSAFGVKQTVKAYSLSLGDSQESAKSVHSK